MKCLYWNIRGLANSPSRLALKRLIISNNPDFFFIAEPWMNFDNFPRFWLQNLNLKLLAMNSRDQRLPNLWCFCKKNINPTLISFDDQQVAFSFCENDRVYCISAIYASNCHIRRRSLWQNLTDLQHQYQNPWCFIGDFNTILGA